MEDKLTREAKLLAKHARAVAKIRFSHLVCNNQDLLKPECQQLSYGFDDVSIVPDILVEYESRKEADTSQKFVALAGTERSIFPAFGASMSFMWEKFAFNLAKAGGVHILPRVNISDEKRIELANKLSKANASFGIAIGVNEDDDFLKEIIKLNPMFISVDIAHGASLPMVKALLKLANLGVKSGVISGNVGSATSAAFLLVVNKEIFGETNTNGIKVGVGPGAACTTRVNTGVGIGQITALLQASFVREKLNPNAFLISDGGVEKPADFVKALVLAEGVMMGKFFSSPDFDTKVIEVNGKKYLSYYGMASKKAKENGGAGVAEYVEGDEVLIPMKWESTEQAVKALKDGLQSAMAYVGAKNLKEFKTNTKFLINTFAVVQESTSRGLKL